MIIGWSYTGWSVSLLEFVEELTSKEDISSNIYRTRPKRSPNVSCQIKTKNIRTIPRLSWVDQIWIRYHWKKYIKSELDTENDVIITEGILGPATVEVADSNNIPTIFFIRSLLVLGHDKFNIGQKNVKNFMKTDFGGKVQYPFLHKCIIQYKNAIENADLVVANSEFTANKLKEMFGASPEIIYPPIKLDNYRVEYNPEGKITMVNPRTKYKGADIFLDIAEQLTDEEFLIAGSTNDSSIKQRIKNLDNVEYMGWQEDMSKVYQQAKLVVVPTRIQEAFGRVAAEAMVSGIPCVVSDRGGLPEVVGKSGRTITDIESTEAWITAIQELLVNDTPSNRLDRKKRVEKFSMDKQVSKLFRLIEDATKN